MIDPVSPPLDPPKDAKGVSAATPPPGKGQKPESASLPHITLPKGGAAIRDIGEKFGVNAVTGTGSVSLPLPLSAARSGFTPSLQLAYDSGSGNAAFGFGWSLSTPAITRKTDKGIPRYLDTEESDVFVLSGAEDLVPVIDGAGVRTHSLRTVNGTAFAIYIYRPRIEGLFARIERWVDLQTGLTHHWRSISRENVTSLYGFETVSRVADPADPGRVFSWRLSRSWDVHGNVASYMYVNENSANVAVATVHEANRTPAGRQTQTYLQTVAYGNTTPYFPDWSAAAKETPLRGQFSFSVVFDYGNHGASPPAPAADQPWPARPDPFSTYRAGFEVRSYRRVQRILFFHNFPADPAMGKDCLVRSLDLLYSDQQTPADPRNPLYTFLVSATSTFYCKTGGAWTTRSLPPMEFDYSQPVIQPEILALDATSLGNLPEGLDGSRFHWVDLDGEGLSGILSAPPGAWYYKRNYSANNRVMQPDGTLAARAQFGPIQTVAHLPSRSSLSGSQMLLDVTGNGRLDLVEMGDPAPGFFERTGDENFEPLQTFLSLPQVDWADPNLKFIDVTGDGLADVLITEDGIFTYYGSLGVVGFDRPEIVYTPWDEEKGPKVVFADGTDTIFVADMSGDGLNDIVRIRNGEACYWPNLGYGRFGARVSMDNAPRFDNEERFDPKRIRLADIDGAGTADILYIGEAGVITWFNQSGNAWSQPTTLAVFPGADRLSSVQAMDLLGNGTACLVWSSPLPAETGTPLLYVDLMGGNKPHLMIGTRNNLGAETRVIYAPSTRFYVADEEAGTPWITRLPFPVQVVERTEIIDWIGRNRAVSRYAYHHGYYDGYEREFRGFGMVEQWDTEEFRTDISFPDGDAVNWNAESWVPPMFTRTWFHTGAFLQAEAVSQQYLSEYWIEPALRAADKAAEAAAMRCPDTVVPDGLNPYEMQEAYRALKGKVLRSETYAQDGTALAVNPYTVAEQNYNLICVQPLGGNLHAVFFACPREAISFQYERGVDDPRVTHAFTLEANAYGDILRSLSVAYPRRSGYAAPEPALSAATQAMLAYDQTRLHMSAVQHVFTNAIDNVATWPDAYRAPMPWSANSAEITGAAPQNNMVGITNLFAFDEIDDAVKGIWTIAWSAANDIAYEAVPASDIDGAGAPAATTTRRIVAQNRTFYRSDDLTAQLPAGQVEPRGLVAQSFTAALTPGLLTAVFGPLAPNATLTEGGYVELPGEAGWWMPSPRVFYSAGDGDSPAAELANALLQFFLPRRAIDPFGGIARIAYDAVNLLPLSFTDAVGNVTSAVNDYRVLLPSTVVDANSNLKSVAFNTYGWVTATAVMDKTSTLGDQLSGYVVDLDEPTLEAQLSNPLADPAGLLGNATTRTIYDPGAYLRSAASPQPLPTAVYTLARETHVSDLLALPYPGAPATTQYQFHFVYSDGLGREIQHKARVADGPIDAAGLVVSPRWVGSGWTILNNKGNPVRQYEPFFSATSGFEFDAVTGVSTVLLYDPPGRVVATLHPDNTWEKVVFNNWLQQKWDGNDTVMIADPRGDADVGHYFQRLLGTGAFTSWYNLRIGGTYGATAEAQAIQAASAGKTAAHAATPAVVHSDALGRECLAIVDNGGGNRYPSRTAFDTQGKPLAVFDALGRRAEEHVLRVPLAAGGFDYCAGIDMAGNSVYHIGADFGARRELNNVASHPIRAWDARGNAFRLLYDAAQRPTQRFVATGGAAEILLDMRIYGEGMAAQNLCGQVFRYYDNAGFVENSGYDYAGNLLSSVRQLAVNTHTSTDWSPLAGISGAAALDAVAAAKGLIPTGDGGRDRFAGSTMYDALNRPVQNVTPHNGTMKPNVIRPGYDPAGLLINVDVWNQQAATPAVLLDPSTADLHATTSITYNQRAQRETIVCGNQTVSSFAYDPLTFALTGVVTTRPSGGGAAPQTVQDLSYYYDPVANITHISDDADMQNVIYFRNQRVDPSSDYVYDPLYRLISATGREHLGQNGGALLPPQQVTNDDSFRMLKDQRGDGTAMGIYSETYQFDPVGNIVSMAHKVSSGGWTQKYSYAEPSQIVATELSNRLSATSLPGDPQAGPYTATYKHDAHGNMTMMPHLPAMSWDEQDRLRSTTRQSVNAGTPALAFYVYDGGGARIRKESDAASAVAQTGVRQSERIYLGPIELYREFANDGTTITLTRETLQIMGDQHCVAVVELRTAGADPGPAMQLRFQYTNHLSSAILELDGAAVIVSYEEYFPYGSTSYQAVANQTDVPKRYRYTGKERDQENDLYYHGARYYAPWLGRWTACDPDGLKSGPNPYDYASSNPIKLSDPDGKQPKLMDVWQYGQKLLNRASLGRNVQLDHPIQVALRQAQRTPPGGAALYTRAISKSKQELTVIVETGRGLFHTEVGKLQAGIRQQVLSGAITHESDMVAATQNAYIQAGKTTNTAVNELSRDTAILSNQATIHETTAITVAELNNAAPSPTTVTDASIEEAFADVSQAAHLEEETAAVVKVAGKTEKILAGAAKVAAPLVKVLKPLAPALKVAGRVAGAAGIAISVVEVVTAKTQEERVDAGVGLAGNALLASDNPVAMAAGAGVLSGQYLEHTLNVSEYSSQHGLDAKAYLERHGVGDTTALVAGGVVTLAATPVALGESLWAKAKSLW
jgi:RHS repeat-associated protein